MYAIAAVLVLADVRGRIVWAEPTTEPVAGFATSTVAMPHVAGMAARPRQPIKLILQRRKLRLQFEDARLARPRKYRQVLSASLF